MVCAYEPVPGGAAARGGRHAPPDAQWAVNQREDVDATLREAATAATEAGLEVRTFARQGDPADAILDVAEEQHADLIVVGNKGMTGAKRFLLGSVPNRVSHHAPVQRPDHPDELGARGLGRARAADGGGRVDQPGAT